MNRLVQRAQPHHWRGRPDGQTEYWGNNYVYDAWGNLYQKNVTKCSAENLQATVTAQNRLVHSNYAYDAAGNMTNDSFHSYFFDLENRISQVDNGATTYTYDGSGQRLRKDVGSSFTEYIDFGGNVVAERNPLALNSSMLSQSGLSTYNPGLIVDGSTACCAWHTDTASAGAWLQVDFGSGNTEPVTQIRISAGTPNYAGNYSVQYSDNGSVWSNAATNFIPNQTGWNSTAWPSVGSHRWWRLYLTNTPGPGAWLNELQLVAETNYIYFNGKRTARRDPSGAVHYYLSDHLGSTSMVVSASGTVENESEYYPWGGELKFSANDSGNHYKFTAKERDAESGLDYIGARYYGNTLGRFLTPDWAANATAVPYANFGNPQSLNLYTYVKNNPTTFGDPDGHCLEDACVVEGIVVLAFLVSSYLASPPGQHALRSGVEAVGGLFHRSNSNTPPPPPATTSPQSTPAVPPPPPVPGQGQHHNQQHKKRAAQLKANQAKGKDFETKVVDATKATDSNVAEQVTLKTESGVKTRMDVVSEDPAGQIRLREAKSSDTAPLTPGQEAAHPEIEQSGATVVGDGKPGYPGGTQIPPTKVEVVRPPQ